MNFMSKQRGLAMATALAAAGALISTRAQISPTSPATQWAPILHGSSAPDPTADQQTGGSEADIVGNLANPSLYMKYDGAGGGTTNGWLGFRIRVGADMNPTGFKSVAMIGFDADLDGKLDLFVGVNNQGSSASLAIWNPGNGANTSPNTTSIVSPAAQTYLETSANYAFSPVTLANDPNATALDLDGGGRPDQFLTFVLPFSDIVSSLATRGILGVRKDTPLQLVAATASQQNSLNQDLNGVNGGVNSPLTWGELGGLTLPYTFSSLQPVPEPNSFAVCLTGFLVLLARRRLKT
jgi:hypothetical protein